MKKLYYLLFLCPLLSLSACDEDDNEVVNMQNQDAPMTVTGINPAEGYTGDQLTVIGTEFGAAKAFVKVFIGQNPTRVISCSEEKIVVEVPEDATTGQVTVELLNEKVTTDLMYKVLGKPSIEEVSPVYKNESYGFAGGLVTFKGSNLGVKKEDVKVLFGNSKTSAEVMSWSSEEFVVKVPDDATSGNISLQISTQKDINTTPNAFRLVEHATLTKITPAKSFKGSEVEIVGTNLGDNATLEGTVVLFGDKVATILSCTSDKIVVKVPDDAEDCKVKVSTPFEEIEETLDFAVAPEPVVSAVSPLSGLIGSEVTIEGNYFGESKDDVEVRFGDKIADIDESGWSQQKLTVKVPANDFGAVALSVTVLGKNADMGVYDSYKVLESPVISSVESDNILNNTLVQVGNVIKIKGLRFDNFALKEVTFNGQKFAGTVMNATEITATIPEGCTSGLGSVSLTFDGLEVDIVSEGQLKVLQAGDDVTEFILKNYGPEFAQEPNTLSQNGSWATPAGWTLNEAAKASSSKTAAGASTGGLDPKKNLLVMQSGSGWGTNQNMDNGKMYQVKTLPAGSYKVELNVTETAGSSSAYFSYFVVSEGNEVPDSKNAVGMTDETLGRYQFEKGVTGLKSFTFTLSEEKEVAIGFSAYTRGNQNAKVSYIKITMAE